MARDLTTLSMEDLMDELHSQVDRLEELLFPPSPKPRAQRVAERAEKVGLRVVREEREEA